MTAPPIPKPVATAFDALPKEARERLLKVRGRLFALAEQTGTGPLTETLKWGQPAYLTEATKAGSTVRLGASAGQAAVFLNCNTTLVDSMRSDFPDAFTYQGNRALLIENMEQTDVLDVCLGRALTYHRAKRERAAS